MRIVEVSFDFGITTSDKWNAVIFFDIVRPDGKTCRNYWESAIKRARKFSKIFWHETYIEILELKKITDSIYSSK